MHHYFQCKVNICELCVLCKKTNLWVEKTEDQIKSHKLQLIESDKYIFSRWKFKFHNQNQSASLIAAELGTGTEKKLWCSQCHDRLNSHPKTSDYRITEWLELEETAEGIWSNTPVQAGLPWVYCPGPCWDAKANSKCMFPVIFFIDKLC